MEKFIDTHAHYNCKQFSKNQDKLFADLETVCSHIITLGTNEETNLETLKLIDKNYLLYGMVGYFPTDSWVLLDKYCESAKEKREILEKQLSYSKIIGLGEIGLDYHWDCLGDKNNIICKGDEARKAQKETLLYQLNLAKELNLPVSMHSRDAEVDTVKVLSNFKEIKGVMHCFSYGWGSAQFYLHKGLYLGVGGTSTYPSNKDLQSALKRCPLDRIVLETDAPYLSPQPVRKEINNSKNIKYVISNLAKLKGISEEEVITQTNKNAKELFKLN